MTEHIEQRRRIEEAVARAAALEGGLSPGRLCARLRRMTAELRRQYALASQSPLRAPVDEWLCDNYYVLEKESKQAVRDIRQLARRCPGRQLTGLYRAVEQVVAAVRPTLDDDAVAAVLAALNERQSLNECQFAFTVTAFKAALVAAAHDAVTATKDAEGMAYAVTSLALLAAVDVEAIVQSCSDVERLLLQDPAGVYSAMTPETRSHYRHVTACIARRARCSERETAERLLAEARAENRHIGYGILRDKTLCAARRRRGIAALALGAVLPLLLGLAAGLLAGSLWLAVLLYLPLWEILRVVIQPAALAGVDADFIPRMDLEKLEGKPATVVLISTLLPKAADTPALERRLEQLFYSNSDPDLYYCVLADLKEWDYPHDEKDESQIAATRKAIEGLNRRYGDRFLLFVRARSYNRTQGRYSGWERKRGAITEFVRFLKGEETTLHTFVGDRGALTRVKYLIALDSDTNLLYENARTLVAAALHPLNRPEVGEDGVVTGGYGILSPKISTDLASAKATPFSRVMSGCGGVTAYETRDKDFYQDLFGESIFAGKGLIDVDCFHQLLDKRFPEGRVLSHDILEGAYLRCGFVSDVEMTDCAPTGMASWLGRLHRWLRGDWQNIVFIARSYRAAGRRWDNPIRTLSKYQLFDNLRRSLTTVAALLCLVAALLLPPGQRGLAAGLGVLAVVFPSLWAAAWSLAGGGFFTVSRKFFTRTLPHTFELVGQGLFLLILLPAQALLTADAAIRSLWRTFVSRKNLLEWTTAAQGEGGQGRGLVAALGRFWLPELFGLLYLLAAPTPELRLAGMCFALVLPVAARTARPTQPARAPALAAADRELLLSYNAAMWRYYEEFANRKNHYLPPDNVQQSPVYRVAARTSPTNIGMMLLSVLAARDFAFIDTDGLHRRVERTLASVEALPKWHGNLYNWYDTETLKTLHPEFVSTVDSGNFLCCLVALKEGLREYLPEKSELAGLIRRVEALIAGADLTVFYDRRRRLFSIGYDMPTGRLVDAHYDFLMSEARLTSYFAVARKTVGKRHWGAMGRAMTRWGSYAGPVSWTGTMFEYYMPHLLLPVYDGSLLGESLQYCLYCQRRRARAAGTPWGVSESAFYAFDNNLNYQYKAHGIQKLGVKRGLDKELVISPYSTFLTLPWAPGAGMRNLQRLRELGVYGRYGFFEAVDFTTGRAGVGALAVTRSYMAHHIGMSMVASCNAVLDMRMQRRFMADPHMRSAEEFLQEKIAKSAVVYDDLGGDDNRLGKPERPRVREERRDITPLAPRCMPLTNGELTDVVTDTGAGHLQFGDVDLTRREGDLLRRAQGVLTIVRMDGVTLPAAKAPFYDPDAEYRVEEQERAVAWYAVKKQLEVGVRCIIHPTISCQQRQVVVRNRTKTKQIAEVLCYLEPVLAPYADYSAHPAYSKLFVTGGYDPQTKTLTFTRRNRDSTSDLFLTVGFLQDIDFAFETRREALMPAPGGLEELLRFPDKAFGGAAAGVPDACAALRFDLLVGPGGQQQATLLLSAARTAAEGLQNIIAMRKIGVLEPKDGARSPLLSDSLEARLGGAALGRLLFTTAACPENRADKRRNDRGQSALWCTGISGDLPIALLEPAAGDDLAALEGYLRLHTALRSLGLAFDLVVVCADDDQRERCRDLVGRHSVLPLLGARGGIFLLAVGELADETRTLLRAVARHIDGESGAAAAAPLFRPVRLRAVAPAPLPPHPEYAVEGGCFAGGRFYVDRSSPLPWSHVLANPAFGTLVSDTALGCTWAVNARENKLTPWYNDIATDNTGELCLLHDGEDWYSLTRGARASFSAEDARYTGKAAQVECEVVVTVSATGCAKYVDVTLHNPVAKARQLECAYYIEPVLSVNRDTARHIKAEAAPGGEVLVLHNPYNTAVRCWAALAAWQGDDPARLGKPRFQVNRGAFLSGDWQDGDLGPTNDPCAAVILPVTLPAAGEARFRFVLAYGATRDSAVTMATRRLAKPKGEEGRIAIHTPDPALDQYINHFAAHQIKAGRLLARCAFYQCGGAYGFRDQLQDACALLLPDPAVARRQILRCAAVQFEEGDVLHWWHNLPRSGGGLKGVRTRFSDDLLWLPYAAAAYVEKTGDHTLLDIPMPYLSAPELAAGEQERYLAPERSPLRESVFDHCVRALRRGYNVGENGLPRIGCGDWNDGFSAVGREGRGTSVWLALFLAAVLGRFARLCGGRGQAELERECLDRAALLRRTVDEHCWDGEWYVRAFFDDGSPMGSRHSEECQIDLLPQTFAVFAGMPDNARVDAGLQSALDRLVDHRLRLVRLFDPPFRHGPQQPGYVKAYPAGIRENGGQYTHAAVWLAMALLRRGRVEEGWKLLAMLNPADRAAHHRLAGQYKLEPYYMAADIYANPAAPGRGGWSLYTGAASWYYRAVLEELLGLTLRADGLHLAPRLPADWPAASVEAAIRGTVVDIRIARDIPAGLRCDGAPADRIPLDGGRHTAEYGI